MKKLLILLLLIFFFAPQISCAARVPKTKTAHSLTKSFFKRYGKKYHETIFGKAPIDQIEIHRIRELSRHSAEVEAFLSFRSGEITRVLLTTKNSPPFGWKVVSWEMLDIR